MGNLGQSDYVTTMFDLLQIHADDIVNSVYTLALLRTFGFSLSGNIDVDGNGHMGEWIVCGYSGVLDPYNTIMHLYHFVHPRHQI